MASRYDNLLGALIEIRQRGITHLRLMEIGTYDGARAKQLLSFWCENGAGFEGEYHGFDLFEDLTPAMSRAELSKTRLPPSRAEVERGLIKALPHMVIKLYQGNTRTTVAEACGHLPPMHVIFVDGGHSLMTIQSDWDSIQGVISKDTIVLLDDYYENRNDYGCQELVSALKLNEPDRWDIAKLDPLDHYPDTKLYVRMIRVTRA